MSGYLENLRQLMERTCYFIYSLLGKRKYNKEELLSDNHANLTIKISNKKEISISVFSESYQVSYSFLGRVRRHYVFKVYATLPDGVDETLKKLYNSPMYFPRLLPRIFSLDRQQKEVIKSFLDIKQTEVNELK